jgi:hypothetical protein
MTNVTTTTTLEPWKRTLRTVVALLVAAATAVPWAIALIQRDIDPGTGLTAILTQVTAVSAAITRFAASPAGNYLFGLIGLDVATVDKITTDIHTAGTDVAPAIDATITAVKAPSTGNVIKAASAAAEAAPAVQSDATTLIKDVQQIGNSNE